MTHTCSRAIACLQCIPVLPTFSLSTSGLSLILMGGPQWFVWVPASSSSSLTAAIQITDYTTTQVTAGPFHTNHCGLLPHKPRCPSPRNSHLASSHSSARHHRNHCQTGSSLSASLPPSLPPSLRPPCLCRPFLCRPFLTLLATLLVASTEPPAVL